VLDIVNAPSSFTFIWKVIRGWLAPETRRKIEVLGKDYKEQLLKTIPAENLPTLLGGSCTCDGLGGCTVSSRGPWMEDRQRGVKRDGSAELGLEKMAISDPAATTNGVATRQPAPVVTNGTSPIQDVFVDAPQPSSAMLNEARVDAG
jgi:hypothetical protein